MFTADNIAIAFMEKPNCFGAYGECSELREDGEVIPQGRGVSWLADVASCTTHRLP